jgi:two-component system, sporulation sensor kinase E
MVQDDPRKSNEANFMALLNFIVDPAAIIDEKGRFLAVNDAFMDLIGLRSKKKLIGMMFLDLDVLDKKNKAKVLKNFRKRMQGLHIDPYEINFTDKTGKDRCVELKASKINYSGQPVDLVLLHDITRRKENARRLKEYSEKMEALVNEKIREIKENKEKLETIFNSSPDAITLLDLKGNIIECNEATAHLHGFLSRDELIGRSVFELISLKKRREASKLMSSILKKGSIKNVEFSLVAKEGKEFTAEASASVISNAAGKPIGFVTITKDITERKKSEEALKESEEKFRNLSEESPNMIFINKQGRVVYANKKCEDLMGYTKEEFYAPTFNFFSIIAPESLKKLNSSYRRHSTGEEVAPYEYDLVTKARKRISAVITTKLIKYEGERAILGIITDITERKQLEDALRTSEEMFRAISTSAMDSIILVDENDKVVYWNPAAEKIFGYTEKEAMSNDLAKLVIPPQGHKPHLKLLKKLTQGSSPEVHLELTALRKDGTEFPMELSATSVKLKDRNYMLGIVRDVSKRKKMEGDLKQERDRLEAVTENIGAGVAIISKDYRILWANRLLKQIHGECEGKICFSMFNKLIEVCPECGVQKIFDNKVPIDTHEYSTKDDKGNTVWVELIVTPIKDEEENVVAALELAVNITERKLMENKLAEYSQKLEKTVEKRTEQLKQTQAKLVKSERLAAIGELAAMVGHDLRNPLTGIKGAAYYLKTKYGADIGVKGKEMLETIERAINYSNKIINDLLDYSRDQKLDLAEVTPKVLLKNALSLLEVPDKIQVVDATENEPRVKADMEKMHRVFVNIIKNAIDAMPEGGTLTIKSREARGKLKIIFKDTGAGMSKETLTTLKRGVPLFSTKAKGMGFGLPICKRIIEAHGGKIAVESKIGKGTKVTVTIPVNPKPVKEGEEKWIVSEPLLSTITTAQKTT